MEKENQIKFSLVILLSFFIHTIIILGIFLPVYDEFLKLKDTLSKNAAGVRDIIVNINEDNKRIVSKRTLLSEKDSSAKGYITKKKGDHWLNNSRDFSVKKGSDATGKLLDKSIGKDKTGLLLTDNTTLVISLLKQELGSIFGWKGVDEFTKIPDKNSFTRDNAIFYSNDGTFSFNTMKFKPFKYFKKMKDKIAAHWFPPLLANSVIGSYAPGRIRIMAIPNQMVKLYFTMNRDGDVIDVGIVESLGNRALDASCLDSIRMSKNFDKVPKEIKGSIVVIRFVFVYIIQ